MLSLRVVLIAIATLLALTSARTPKRADALAVQDTPLPVRVVESGFATGAPFPDPTFAMLPRPVVIMVRIENPNADVAAEGITLTLQLRAGRQAAFFSDRLPVAQLLPGEQRNVVVRVQMPADLVDAVVRDGRVDAEIGGPLRWRAVVAVPPLAVQLRPDNRRVRPLEVPGLSWVHDDFLIEGRLVGITTPVAAGTITNPFDVYIAGVDVSAVAFDRQGRMIGGGQRTIALPPYEATAVGVWMIVTGDLDSIARVELTAAFPYIDLAPYAP